MRRLLAVALALSPSLAFAGPSDPRLAAVRAIHMKDYASQIGDARAVSTCLMRKLADRGPFTFPDSPDGADAVLVLTATVPSTGQRAWGHAPTASVTMTAPDGSTLWAGSNRYNKGTTVWGTKDMECGLADGLARKIISAIEQAGQPR